MLSRGYAPQGMAALFEFVRLQSNLKATLSYFRRGSPRPGARRSSAPNAHWHQDDVLGALDDKERATLHALLLRAAGGQLPSGGCAEAASGTC